MFLAYQNLVIRNATEGDAQQLCTWWNDGKIMAHAGYYNGLGITTEQAAKSFAEDDEKSRRHVIEYDDKPIGEMNYRTPEDKVARIGIKICDFAVQEKGLGTILLTIFIDALFSHYGYEKNRDSPSLPYITK
ncbi:MAG: GNAT family N-acetyltransferase [Defluviitaleaceae bacterium]|nr:GNAT family N-acetyltransferase [Defluviitaleaceae bacterium]